MQNICYESKAKNHKQIHSPSLGAGPKKLEDVRKLLKEAAPKATEAIKWGSPVLEDERILFSFSAHKNHINFMPTRSTLEQFRDELKDYKTGRDTVQLPYAKPLPKELIKKLAKYRVQEVNEGSLWMH